MILDKLENWQYYEEIGRLFPAFKALESTDWDSKDLGKHQIDSDRLYAIISEFKTKTIEESLYEAHRQYVDLHIVLKGNERIGYANIDSLKISADYDEKKDFANYQGEGSFLILTPGYFAVFYPKDAHMPGISVDEVETIKKLVLKIAI